MLMSAQPALRRADQITRLALTQERQVRLADHAPVHHPDPLGHAVFLFHYTHDCLHGGHIGAVAREHLKAQGQTLRRADQTDADLLVAAALIARVAALRLGITLRLALEVSARHVVE